MTEKEQINDSLKNSDKNFNENFTHDKEQIIIDGCNVSGCENYRPKDRFTCYPYICNCHQKPDCYFKQLARKTQECKELKKIINGAKNSNLDLKSFLVGEAVQNEYEQQLDQLKKTSEELQKENKELKKQHQADKGLITSMGKMNYQLLQEYDKLKTTLAELEVIAMGIMDDDLEESSAYYDAKQILQKISECEVKNEN